ncbi:MAG: HAD family hydrolase [Pirellulales bacterium]|nr:HAD family hydrolase [Pirellulales bacterium]
MLRPLDGIRAVLFDLYGTLLVSGSGEVGTARQQAAVPGQPQARALDDALAAMEISTSRPVGPDIEVFFQAIEASHARGRSRGIDYPEVDIVEIWREVLSEFVRRGLCDAAVCRRVDLQRLAVEYEARANPCWPMPGAKACLSQLRQGGLILGIISNAQFFTAELLAALLGEATEDWGFNGGLQYYSYRHGRAKPGLALFELAAEDLRGRGLGPAEVLYVGNDVLNDVCPAHEVGFYTALFAGDARSLRRREGEPRVQAVAADLVVTELEQLIECITAQD